MKKLIIALLLFASNIMAYPNYITIINNTEYTIKEVYLTKSTYARAYEFRWGNNVLNKEIPPKTGKRIEIVGSDIYDFKIILDYEKGFDDYYFFDRSLIFNELLGNSDIEIEISKTGMSIKKAT